MVVKRKRSEAVRQDNLNERHLRSSRTFRGTDTALKSRSKLRAPRSSCKTILKALDTDIVQSSADEDLESARTERPLKLLKFANPSHQQLSSGKNMGCSDDEIHSAGLNHQKANRPSSLEETVISHHTPKRKRAIVEIPPSKHASMKRVSQDRLFPPGNAVMDDTNAFSIQIPVCLDAQKKEILRSLRTRLDTLDAPATELAAQKQLSQLIQGSMTWGEGNSCILLGPRGSGKTRIVESSVYNLAAKPIILRLTGWVQSTDKEALREIATQLLHQTGSYLFSDTEPQDPTFEDGGNPFIEQPQVAQDTQARKSVRLPPSSQLHALIPVLLTLKRPVIVVLDAFDLFALHPRQSLLYCLLDNVQSCRSAPGSQGIIVIGITSRVDTIQLLEKRVKSRFSGRIIRTAPPNDLEHWLNIAKNSLLVPITLREGWLNEEWHQKWISSVKGFLSDSRVLDVFRETFGISKDVKVLIRLLTQIILYLRPGEPYLSFKTLSASIDSQRSRPCSTQVNNLSYPMVCLIIAGSQVEITGHPTFSFGMLFEKFRDQVRNSTSAPVQVNGGHVGMVKCTREVLLSAFNELVSSHIFLPTAGPSTMQAKEFTKVRCILDREMMKKIVEKCGQIHLKKWFNKG